MLRGLLETDGLDLIDCWFVVSWSFFIHYRLWHGRDNDSDVETATDDDSVTWSMDW